MSLNRTGYGVKNTAKIRGKDLIVYVEGGHEDVSGNKSEISKFRNSDDSIFWHSIFCYMINKKKIDNLKKIEFLPRGSVNNVKGIASSIIENKVKDSVVCIDRDLNDNDDILKDYRVFYTKGYSWENDILSPLRLNELYQKSAKCFENNFLDTIQRCYRKFSLSMRLLLKCECLFWGTKTVFIPKKKNGGGIIIDREPFFRKGKIKDIVEENRATITENIKRIKTQTIDFQYDVYGHLLWDFCYTLTKKEVKKKYRKSSLSEDSFFAQLVFIMEKDLCNDVECVEFEHYSLLFERFKLAQN